MIKMKNCMAHLQFLLCCCIFSMAMINAENDPNEYVDHDLITLHYDIAIITHISEAYPQNFYGEATLLINVINHKMNYLIFRSINLSIINIMLIRKTDNSSIIKPARYWYNIATEKVTLFFDDHLQQGLYTMSMIFIGGESKSETSALFKYNYVTEDGSISLLVPSHQLRTITALGLVPYWGESRSKDNFTVFANYKNYTDLSPYDSIEWTIKDGLIWEHMKTDFGTQTHLIGAIVSDLRNISGNDKNIILWCRPEIEDQIAYVWSYIGGFSKFLVNALNYTTEYTREQPVHHVVIPDFQDETLRMINRQQSRLIIYKESALMVSDLQIDVLKTKMKRLIARKILSGFLGDSSYWINDGLAALLEMFVVKEPKNKIIFDMYIIQDERESLYLDNRFEDFLQTWLPDDRVTHFSHPRSIRVPFLLRMLESITTEEVFKIGVRNYIKKHAPVLPKNPAYLWDAIQTVFDEKFRRNDINLTAIMNSALYQQTYPILNVTRQTDGWVHVSLENVYASDLYVLPVTYTTQYEARWRISFNSVRWLNYTYLHVPQRFVKMKQDGWIIFNVQQFGYYRINYDENNWEMIIKYINAEEHGIYLIPEINRAQMIDDAFYFMIRNHLSASIFWDLLDHLYNDVYLTVWYPAFKAFEYMASIFQFSTVEIKNIKNRMLPTLEKILSKIKYIDDRGHEHTESLRQEAARWACVLGSTNCISAAANIYAKYLMDPVFYKIMPFWKEWTYCNAFKTADQASWLKEFDNHINDTDENEFLRYLTCSNDSQIILNYILYMKNNEKNMKEKSCLVILFSLIQKQMKKPLLLDLILQTSKKLMRSFSDKKDISIAAMIISIINHLTDAKQFEQITKFVNDTEEINSFDRMFENRLGQRRKQIVDQMKWINLYSQV